MKLLALTLAAARLQVDPSLPLETQFELWGKHYNREYSSSEEKAFRFDIFCNTAKKVYTHNEKFEAGLSTYRQGLNFMSDLTKEEYRQRLGYRRVSPSRTTEFPYSHVQVTPVDDIDWNAKGAVTYVKDQGETHIVLLVQHILIA